MKKLLTLLLTAIMAVACCFGFTACGDKKTDIKIGLICLHGESSTYDKNFIDAFKAGAQAKGAELVIKTDVPEGVECYEAAIDFVDQGCDIIFADSFGHEEHMLKAAKENPEVQFCHATGTMAHTEKVANFHNAFASIYEGRYLAGYAAGMKIAEMEKNNALVAKNFDENGAIKVGYVGAFPYAEVKSGYTSWYLGVKAGYKAMEGKKDIVMDVLFTSSWYDEVAEKSSAETLIAGGAALISQHADSWGAPNACEDAGVPNVSYNGSTESSCPETFIVSSRINWQPYCEYIIDCVKEGKEIDPDWVGTIANGAVELTALGKKAPAAGTQEKLDAVKESLVKGEIKVFDLNNFTVNGQKLSVDHLADVDTDAAFTADTKVVETVGEATFFAESKYRSAPYFDINIDGIKLPA